MNRTAAILVARLERFFEQTSQGFDRAAGQLGESAHNFLIAGRRVRVRFAGSALKHLVRPLAHLNCSPVEQSTDHDDFEILAWDSADGWLPPRPPWDFQQLAHCGSIAGLENDRVCVNYSADHGLLCLYHRRLRRALYWLPEARQLPFWETAAPFRVLLHWWSQSFGGQVSHAAAVGCDGKGVLLAGRGGSGKSTTAICCVDAGMEYVGDDYVLLTSEPVPTAHSLYHSAKIHTPFLRQSLSHWQGRVAAEIGRERKSLLFLNESVPHQVRDRLPICGVIQPKVCAAPQSRISPQSPSLGLLAIAPSTMYQLPEARQTTLSFFAEWMQNIPTATLHLGGDLSSAPRELTKLLGKQEVQHAA